MVKKVNFKPIIISIIIGIMIEVLLFNITSYRLLFGNYETRKDIKISNNQLEGNEHSFITYYEIDNINMDVGTIKIDFKSVDEEIKAAKIFLEYYDDTNATSSRSEILGNVVVNEEVESSKYITTYFSGNLRKLIVGINTQQKGFIIDSLKISLNEKIPFKFNLVRALVTILVIYFIYLFKESETFNSKYSIKSFKQELALFSVLTLFLLSAMYINFNATEEVSTDKKIIGEITTEEGIYNKEFVDALKEKRLYLQDEVSEKFAGIQDPYSTSERDNIVIRGVDYIWDTAYYNGHMYIYFGVLPALAVFLPFNLITHSYLKISFVIAIITVAILIVLKELLCKIINLFYKEKIDFKVVFSFLVILYSGTMLLFLNNSARVYELAILSALYLVLQGIYFFVKAYEKNDDNLDILLGSLFMALSVACRPTALLSSFIIAPYLIKVLITRFKNVKENKKSFAKFIIFILSVVVPYLLVGITLMYYNYIRFDNPFNFGSKYQLTICNVSELKNRFATIPVGLFTNLFMLPSFISTFPFIGKINEHATFYGYYYIEDMIGGLFAICPICFVVFSLFKFNKKDINKTIKIIVNSLIIIGVLIAVISIMMAGSCQRYLVDYAWIFIFASMFIICSFLEKIENEDVLKLLEKIISIIMIYSLIMAFLMGITGEKNYIEANHYEKYINLREIICFWE